MNQEHSELIKARGKEAAELMENGKFVSLGNLVTKNVQSLPSQPDVQVRWDFHTETHVSVIQQSDWILQINFGATELVEGPLGLDAAVFLADVLIKYRLQVRLEHSIRYVTSDCAKLFGECLWKVEGNKTHVIEQRIRLGGALNKEMNWNEENSKKYWRQTSFLTGWEIIRR